MPEPEEDSLRRELQAILATSPSPAELRSTYAGRILSWLASPGPDIGSEDMTKRGRKRAKSRR